MANSFGIGILLALIAAVVIVIAATRSTKRRRPATVVDERPLSLSVSRVIAVVWIGLTAIGTLYAVIEAFVSSSVPVNMPVAAFWPEAYPTTDMQYGDATVVGGAGFTSADVAVDGLDLPARLWLAAGHLALGSTSVIVGIAVFLLCSRLLKNEPFRAVLSAPAHLAGTAVIVGGLVWQFCFGVAGSLASIQVLGSYGFGYDENAVARALDPDMPVIGLPQAATFINVDFWPVIAGLALFAIAAAFRHSERLQRDTEGLV